MPRSSVGGGTPGDCLRSGVPDTGPILVTAIAAQGVCAVVALDAVVSTQGALVVVLTDLGGCVESVAGSARQKSDAGVAADRVVAPLGRHAVVLELALVYVNASQGQLVATVAWQAVACKAPQSVDALLIAAAGILKLQALVHVEAVVQGLVVPESNLKTQFFCDDFLFHVGKN